MTDGFIGNEAEALGEIHRCLGNARIFSFGVGSSTNRFLLDHMAKMGNGAVAYLGLNDDANEVMGQYFDRISHPALTDIQIDWGGMKVSEVFPRKVPDLFAGRPVILAGRFTGSPAAGEGPATIHVKGRAGRETREFDIPVRLDRPGDARRARGPTRHGRQGAAGRVGADEDRGPGRQGDVRAQRGAARADPPGGAGARADEPVHGVRGRRFPHPHGRRPRHQRRRPRAPPGRRALRDDGHRGQGGAPNAPSTPR